MNEEGTGTEASQGGESASTTETPQTPRGKRPRQKSKEQLLAEGWTKLSTEDLNALVNQLWNDFDENQASVWQELNRRKILSVGSAMWSYQNLRTYLEKNPDVKKKRRAKPKPAEEPKPKKTETRTPPLAEPVKETIQLTKQEPMWKEELEAGRDTIYVKEELLKRAKEKAKKEKLKTGGNLSRLCAVLLWHYIGCPEDLIETE